MWMNFQTSMSVINPRSRLLLRQMIIPQRATAGNRAPRSMPVRSW
jgi:hypothetical protein